MTRRAIHKPCPRNLRPPTLALRAGFTLVELVIVIVLTGIVAAMTAVFITRPISGYVDLTRRARLVDVTESALRRMARDIRIALPNSVRVTDSGTGASFAIEVLPTLDGGRYFAGTGTPGRDLDITIADTDFEINGCFQGLTAFQPTHRLVINNLGTAGNDNVYTAVGAQSVVTLSAGTTLTLSVNPVGACGSGGRVHHINLNPGYRFKQYSPLSRLFVIEGPVSYVCNTATGTLTRHQGYAIQIAQPTDAAVAPLSAVSALVTDRVTACTVTTSAPQVQNRGIVTLSLTLAEQGEQVRLIQQVQLDNSR